MAHWQTTSQAKRGFLLVELVIGLVIVALVMLGAAAIMGAVAQGWSDQDVTRSTQLQANQTYVRVQNAGGGKVCRLRHPQFVAIRKHFLLAKLQRP